MPMSTCWGAAAFLEAQETRDMAAMARVMAMMVDFIFGLDGLLSIAGTRFLQAPDRL